MQKILKIHFKIINKCLIEIPSVFLKIKLQLPTKIVSDSFPITPL